MSTDPKHPKPIPSADEINAYLELSAARTRLRLPLAKGAALVGAGPTADPLSVEKNEKRTLPLSAAEKLPTERQRRADAARPGDTEADGGEVWRPFSMDDKR